MDRAPLWGALWLRGWLWLPLTGIAGCARATRACEELLAIRQRHVLRGRNRLPVPGSMTGDGDGRASGQVLVAPPSPVQRVRSAKFDGPVDHFAVRSFYVDEQPRVRIDPFHLCDRGRERDGLSADELDRKGVMGEHGSRGGEDADCERDRSGPVE